MNTIVSFPGTLPETKSTAYFNHPYAAAALGKNEAAYQPEMRTAVTLPDRPVDLGFDTTQVDLRTF